MRTLRLATTLALFRAAIRWRGVRAAMGLASLIGKVPRWPRRVAIADPVGVVTEIRRVAGKMPFRADCLPQSLTAWLALHRAGLRPTVRLGIALDGTSSAHAWVELAGAALCESTSERYHTFAVATHLPSTVVGNGP